MRQKILDAVTTDGTKTKYYARSSQIEISLVGTFDGATVKFQDNILSERNDSDLFDNGWADVIDINTGVALSITEPTNEIELSASVGTGESHSAAGRWIRAVITGAGASTEITGFMRDGV